MKSIIIAAQKILHRSDISRMAIQYDGAVFGGYLRDLISRMKLPKSDIDIWFPNKDSARKFIFALLEYCSINLVKRHKRDYYKGHKTFEHYRAHSPDFETYIDIVISDKIHPEGGADVDINAFIFDKDGLKINSPPGMQLDPAIVIQHAQTGVFQRLPACRDSRFERMKAKGWTPVMESEPSFTQIATRISLCHVSKYI